MHNLLSRSQFTRMSRTQHYSAVNMMYIHFLLILQPECQQKLTIYVARERSHPSFNSCMPIWGRYLGKFCSDWSSHLCQWSPSWWRYSIRLVDAHGCDEVWSRQLPRVATSWLHATFLGITLLFIKRFNINDTYTWRQYIYFSTTISDDTASMTSYLYTSAPATLKNQVETQDLLDQNTFNLSIMHRTIHTLLIISARLILMHYTLHLSRFYCNYNTQSIVHFFSPCIKQFRVAPCSSFQQDLFSSMWCSFYLTFTVHYDNTMQSPFL